MISISAPAIGNEEKKAVLRVLDSGLLAQGRVVQQFEEAFASYCGVQYAVATSSGTTALHLALLAHGIGPGDEVITTPFTFVATVNAVLYVGATPVFADIDPQTFNLDPAKAELLINSRTRAILPVHLFGQPADMGHFSKLAGQYGLVLIEDACQAHGAEWEHRKVGSFGTGCFSFYPTKNMTTGEGGMVTTNDRTVADRIRILRNQGMKTRYDYVDLGFNFRMSDIHAAIGLAQLCKLETFIKKRLANAHFLSEKLIDYVECPIISGQVRHVFNQYTVKVRENRDKVLNSLQAAGVGAGVYYPLPLHHNHVFSNLAMSPCPFTEETSQRVLSLPVHPGLRQKDLDFIVERLISIIKS